jgi:hypothetical protein
VCVCACIYIFTHTPSLLPLPLLIGKFPPLGPEPHKQIRVSIPLQRLRALVCTDGAVCVCVCACVCVQVRNEVDRNSFLEAQTDTHTPPSHIYTIKHTHVHTHTHTYTHLSYIATSPGRMCNECISPVWSHISNGQGSVTSWSMLINAEMTLVVAMSTCS